MLPRPAIKRSKPIRTLVYWMEEQFTKPAAIETRQNRIQHRIKRLAKQDSVLGMHLRLQRRLLLQPKSKCLAIQYQAIETMQSKIHYFLPAASNAWISDPLTITSAAAREL